ncbi:MAG: SH3 domain-containing protein [Kiritimatiellales bacterium]|nr:SH3 domain-containing protein [Kiritimatiellales bacterium]
MNRPTLCMLAASIAVSTGFAGSDQPVRVRVTGDRVSLRGRPDRTAELLDRAMRDDELVCMGATNGWVAVQPPDNIGLWVMGEYVSNATVQASTLNVRSGPSMNYSIVGVINKGEQVTLRGELEKWLKISPPPGSRVWISEDFVEPVVPIKPEPLEAEVKPAEPPEIKPDPAALAQAEKDKLAEEIAALKERLNREEAEKARALAKAAKAEQVISVAPKPVPQAVRGTEPLILKLDKNKPQYIYEEIPGILQRANPGLYQLVFISGDIAEPICLVRGEKKQMEERLNRSLLIKGYVNWIEGVDMPIIRPVKIVEDPILENY